MASQRLGSAITHILLLLVGSDPQNRAKLRHFRPNLGLVPVLQRQKAETQCELGAWSLSTVQETHAFRLLSCRRTRGYIFLVLFVITVPTASFEVALSVSISATIVIARCILVSLPGTRMVSRLLRGTPRRIYGRNRIVIDRKGSMLSLSLPGAP
eukprot:scaffold741_cov303-Prasinococcus_capsulatus_cf.AAC.8